MHTPDPCAVQFQPWTAQDTQHMALVLLLTMVLYPFIYWLRLHTRR